MVKCRDIFNYEQEMRKEKPSFKGLYPDDDYWTRLDKCVKNFDELVSQVLEASRKKIAPNYCDDKYTVEVSNKEDQSGRINLNKMFVRVLHGQHIDKRRKKW